MLRAQAQEKIAAAKGEKPLSAAADYLDLYYRFPLNDEAKAAGQKIPSLQFALGESFPGTPMQTQIARAEAFFVAKRWREARTEYASLLPKLSGSDHERAELRIAQCDVAIGRQAGTAERSFPDRSGTRCRAHLLHFAGAPSQKLESRDARRCRSARQTLSRKAPGQRKALFAAGNFYWVNLDRDRAADFYRRALEIFPDGKNAHAAAWRVAWTAYLERKPEAADMLEAYVRRFPTSSYIQDALYWLGRSYERSGNPDRARSFYRRRTPTVSADLFWREGRRTLRPGPMASAIRR